MSVVTWEVAKTWSQNHPERLRGSMSQNLQHAYALCAKILTQPWDLWAVLWLPYWFVSPLHNGQCDLQVFFAVLIGAFSIGQAAPNFDKLITAAGASVAIYNVIDRVSNRLVMHVDTLNIHT